MTRTVHSYRPRPFYRNVGVATTVFSLVMGLLSICAALFFAEDEALPQRLLTAAIFATFYAAFLSLGVWLILFYRRYRLEISEHSVRQRGVITDRIVDPRAVEQLKWRCYPAGGSVRVTSPEERLTIELGNFERLERSSIIDFFHHSVAAEHHQGWDAFQGRFKDTPRRRKQNRRALLILTYALALHSIAFLLMWIFQLGHQFLLMSLVNAAAFVYFYRRRNDGSELKEEGMTEG